MSCVEKLNWLNECGIMESETSVICMNIQRFLVKINWATTYSYNVLEIIQCMVSYCQHVPINHRVRGSYNPLPSTHYMYSVRVIFNYDYSLSCFTLKFYFFMICNIDGRSPNLLFILFFFKVKNLSVIITLYKKERNLK